jgi:hypothetical protein
MSYVSMVHYLTSWNWSSGVTLTYIYNQRCWINSAGFNQMFNPSWFLFKRPIVLFAYTVLLFAYVRLVPQSVMAVNSPSTMYNAYVLNLSGAFPCKHPVAAVYTPEVRRQVRFKVNMAVSGLWSFGMWRRVVWTKGALRKRTWRNILYPLSVGKPG